MLGSAGFWSTERIGDSDATSLAMLTSPWLAITNLPRSDSASFDAELSQNPFDDVSVNIGEAVVSTAVEIG
jgi:hypothetical protein